MPEAPEVQAHAERMTATLAGTTLTKFGLLSFATLKTFNPTADNAIGSQLTEVSRRGKCLVLKFENGQAHIVHLIQGGRLRPDPKQSRKPRFGLARWVFGDVAWLLTEAGTERKAGIWIVEGDPLAQGPLAHLGPEASELTQMRLDAILSERSRRLHGVLRDQRILAGLGRMLANEICFAARLSPFTITSKLATNEPNHAGRYLKSPNRQPNMNDPLMTSAKALIDHQRFTIGKVKPVQNVVIPFGT